MFAVVAAAFGLFITERMRVDCVRIQEIYAELDWMIVFLLAGVIALGIAMDETGGAQWIGGSLADLLGPLGPTAVVTGFGPGGYRFSDYPRVGGLLSLLLLITASLLIPVFWPS